MNRPLHCLSLMSALALLSCSDGTRPFAEAAHPEPTDAAQPSDGPDFGAPLPPGAICRLEETRCVDGRLRTCLDDQTGWLVESCPDGLVCRGRGCVEVLCEPGTQRCSAEGVERCNEAGDAFEPVAPCPVDRTCLEGACVSPQCSPGETACADKQILTCADDGVSWTREPCAPGERCIDGACVLPTGFGPCPPGEVLCAPAGIVTCDEVGGSWTETPCLEGQACFGGRCVECVRDQDCEAGQACGDGVCTVAPVRIVTETLPVGAVDVPYEATVEALAGRPPYVFTLDVGALPRGLMLAADGQITGRPTDVEAATCTILVTDADERRDSRRYTLRVLDAAAGLQIVTESPLPSAEEGAEYATTFEALGGQAPYGFFLVAGSLPMGLGIDATGRLAGIPTEIGLFEFRLRAVDAATPPAFAEKDFALEVTVAPLVIYGDQELNLFVTRVFTLPTLALIPNIPLPYDQRLTARGGLRPHHWTEQPLPDLIAGFVPMSGLPDGLILDDDGRLHGAVEDASQVIEVTIPFTMIVLTGYFFSARVTDSQNLEDSDEALFVIPTLPIGN